MGSQYVKSKIIHAETKMPSDSGGEGKPHPRCLATVPGNIEELINQFKMQEKEICSGSQK